jgi:exonuclease III
LDYIFLSKPLFEGKIKSAEVLKDYRGIAKASDHAPIVVTADV